MTFRRQRRMVRFLTRSLAADGSRPGRNGVRSPENGREAVAGGRLDAGASDRQAAERPGRAPVTVPEERAVARTGTGLRGVSGTSGSHRKAFFKELTGPTAATKAHSV